ncbi:MAG TPA: F0F1 ATP synthase subunit B [Planctomycetota bacterium]|nr:F0F1 ATP synthase subunit B [Planctomycetota bacterium]
MPHANLIALALVPAPEGDFNPFDPAQGGGMLWTWVIFGAALFFMWRFVMGPVVRALEARDGAARKAIEDAERASRDAEAARAEVEVRLGEARAEAVRLLAEARERAGVREREIVEDAEKRSHAMIEAARRAIRVEQDKAIAAIRDEVVELSLASARAVLERNVGGEDDRRLVSQMVSRVKSGPGTVR